MEVGCHHEEQIGTQEKGQRAEARFSRHLVGINCENRAPNNLFGESRQEIPGWMQISTETQVVDTLK